ncbi:MarR family winged helix-turn-helix transcriptional regulator [Rothia sp. L_38]|uniref:MarR family winged helix-turn-helix transcriptional regulator n=1 Tax=Rothia sp. L_38 TaxID=3422315 RepID=UPI003D6C0877
MEPSPRNHTYWSFIDRVGDNLTHQSEAPVNIDATLLAMSLNRASVAITHDFESKVHRPAGSSWAAYRVLFALWHSGATSASSLANITGMTRAAVSNISKPLETKGLITKAKDPEDGRGTLVELTPAGTEFISSIFTQQNQLEARWAEKLTPIERTLLVELLRKLSAES